MIDSPSLFDQPPAQRHSPTSLAAAEQIKPSSANLRERVYAFIEAAGPVTDEVIASATELNPSTARPRRIELLRAGRIRASLIPQVTSSGRKAVAWEVVTSAPPASF